MTEFKMPTLGADMEAGTLARWLKKPGDALTRGDVIGVVDTEKGAIEIEVYDEGVFERALVAPGQRVPVGTVLAIISTPGETVTPAPSPAPPLAPAPAPPLAGAPLRASPGARRAAKSSGVDLRRVAGTGPGGAITREDVEHVAPVDKATAMRQAIAASMSRSKREIPHLYLSTTIDMTSALAWLSAENQRRPVDERLLPAVLLLKAVANAAVEVPGVNGFWRDGAFEPATNVHVGCAIALRGGGLVAPALHDADRKSLGDLMAALTDLVTRARGGTLRSSELADPTITVTNLGDLGVEEVLAVIYPPQVAIVGFGKLVERPWVNDGRIEIRTVVTATVSADHRAIDGRMAGRCLAAIARALQRAERL
jgi:pyruvate dehydrogenase E2 component (dihydrolipoamide acetyltransferase)